MIIYNIIIAVDRKIKYRAAALIKIQSALRGYRVRKQQKPRLSAYRRALALQARFNDVGSFGSKLSDKSKAQWVERIKSFSAATKQLLLKIKTDVNNKNLEENNQTCLKLEKELNIIFDELRSQVKNDEKEKEKVKEVQLQMQKEKEKQLSEIKEKQDQEKRLQELRNLESKRQQEEILRQKKIQELEIQLALEQEDEARRLKKMEQERLDAELARRLAMEDGHNIVVDSNKVNNNNNVQNGKYNLSSWSYAQLRDTINNSNSEF